MSRMYGVSPHPAQALANFLADYWNRQNQYLLVSSLKGMFAAASMSGGTARLSSRIRPSTRTTLPAAGRPWWSP